MASLSFLKQLGVITLKGVQIATGLAPVVSPFLPQSTQPAATVVTNDLNVIGGIIASAEVAGQSINLSSADKLKAATPVVAQAIVSSSLLAGKKIADPELFNRGAQKVADGIADVLNAIHADSLKVVEPQDHKVG